MSEYTDMHETDRELAGVCQGRVTCTACGLDEDIVFMARVLDKPYHWHCLSMRQRLHAEPMTKQDLGV